MGSNQIDRLRKIFDFVVTVPPIIAEFRQITSHQNSRYKKWTDFVFTKIQSIPVCKRLGFKKFLLLDADVLFLHDPSALFKLSAPAGLCSWLKFGGYESHSKVVQKPPPSVSNSKSAVGYRQSPLCKESTAEPYGVRGCMMLLEANMTDYHRLVEHIRRNPSDKPGRLGTLGSGHNICGADEWLFTVEYANWTHIHPIYCSNSWHPHYAYMQPPDSCPEENIVGLHYVADKPWNDGKDWADFAPWKTENHDLRKFLDKEPREYREDRLGKHETLNDVKGGWNKWCEKQRVVCECRIKAEDYELYELYELYEQNEQRQRQNQNQSQGKSQGKSQGNSQGNSQWKDKGNRNLGKFA